MSGGRHGRNRLHYPAMQTAAPKFGDLRVRRGTSDAESLERVGPYEILRLLGEGGMGRVYLAEQIEPVRRQVAIKILKAGLDVAEVAARFDSERQALALMNHPCVATVYDAGTTETDRPYFVMEYVPGLPITEFCDRHQLAIKERLELAFYVAKALQHAHSKGVVHRDVKPSNILVIRRDGRLIPKVIDFGVAKATSDPLTGRAMMTAPGQLIGTPEYMSPEQAALRPGEIDARSDVYSLGVVLYELLTGTLPFDPSMLQAASYGAIQRVICELDPPRPSVRLATLGDACRPASGGLWRPTGAGGWTGGVARMLSRGDRESGGAQGALVEVARARSTDPRGLIRQVRGELDWIVMKCLEKDRARRYQSAEELAADLKRHLANERVLAGPPSRGYRVQKLVQRNRTMVAVLACLFLALLAGAAGTVGTMIWALRERDRAVLAERRERQERQRAEAALERAAAERFGASSELGRLVALADELVALNRLAEAEPLLRDAAEQALDSSGGDPTKAGGIVDRYARLLESLGRTDEAAAWRKRLADRPASSPADKAPER